MKKTGKRLLILGLALIAAFAVWTVLIQTVDVQPVGQNGTDIGFAAFNCWFFGLTGVNMTLYTITDWLGLIPVFICILFCGVGFVQLIKRKSLFKVDYDIIVLGVYYIIVIFAYLIFDMIPINYRPVLIEGHMEASYPSSTTLLVLSVMPTLAFQADRRLKNDAAKKSVNIFAGLFSAFMVAGRLISGVHWFTDIFGSVLISAGLFSVYISIVLLHRKKLIWGSRRGIL